MPIDNDFFYVTTDDKNANGILKPKHPYTLRQLEKIMITDGNLALLEDLFEDPEGEKMTRLLSGLAPNLPPSERLAAAVTDSLIRSRNYMIRNILETIVHDLLQRKHEDRTDIQKMLLGSVIGFITEKADNLTTTLKYIRKNIDCIPKAAQPRRDHSTTSTVENKASSDHIDRPRRDRGTASTRGDEASSSLCSSTDYFNDQYRAQVRKVSSTGRSCIVDVKERNGDISKIPIAKT